MPDPARTLREMGRQNAVVMYGLAGPDRQDLDVDELDSITHTLKHFLDVDYAAVHIFDDDAMVTLAAAGQPQPPPVPRTDSICSTVLDHSQGAAVIVVPDAQDEPLLRDNPFVDGQHAVTRFYAATPLRTASGFALGTLCAASDKPRTLDEWERHLLLHLGYAVVHVLERRRRERRPVDAPAVR